MNATLTRWTAAGAAALALAAAGGGLAAAATAPAKATVFKAQLKETGTHTGKASTGTFVGKLAKDGMLTYTLTYKRGQRPPELGPHPERQDRRQGRPQRAAHREALQLAHDRDDQAHRRHADRPARRQGDDLAQGHQAHLRPLRPGQGLGPRPDSAPRRPQEPVISSSQVPVRCTTWRSARTAMRRPGSPQAGQRSTGPAPR